MADYKRSLFDGVKNNTKAGIDMKRKLLIACLIPLSCLALALTAWAYYYGVTNGSSDEAIPDVRQEDKRIAVEAITTQAVVRTTRYSGVVEAFQRAKLVFRVEGPLVAINVRPGDRVKKGDLRCRLILAIFRTMSKRPKLSLTP